MEDIRENIQQRCHYKKTPRSEESLRVLRNRISRMIGQLGGIQTMLNENRYCGDILIQISAVESALQNLGYEILREHLDTCVVEEIQNGNAGITAEVLELIRRVKR